MHSAACPSCGTRVEFDFLSVAGVVWCPTCQQPFSPEGLAIASKNGSPDFRVGSQVTYKGEQYEVSGGGQMVNEGPNKGRIVVTLRHKQTDALKVVYADEINVPKFKK